MGTKSFTVPDGNFPQDDSEGGEVYEPRFSGEDADPDAISDELGDDPTEVLGVPADALAEELDRLDGEDPDIVDDGDRDEDADDMREYIEDADEDDFTGR